MTLFAKCLVVLNGLGAIGSLVLLIYRVDVTSNFPSQAALTLPEKIIPPTTLPTEESNLPFQN
jgi:hypothetical protein